MTFALYTCIVSPHQIPLARAILRLHSEVTFYYVYTQELPPDATKRGWGWHEKHDWLVSAIDEPQRAKKILDEADVVLSGERDIELFEWRSRAGKKTLYMFERWFKPLVVGVGGRCRWKLPGWVRMLVPRYWKMARRIVRLANDDQNFKCLAIGPWAKKDMKLIGVREDKIYPWAYFVESTTRESLGVGVDGRCTMEDQESTVRCTTTPSTNTLKILWAGRMMKLKRVDTVIKAVKRLNAMGLGSAVSLTLLGRGEDEPRLKGLSEGVGNISFHPGVPIDQVRQIMREHDVLVFSSNGEDGWGAVVNEALEEGLIVLGTEETGASATMLPQSHLFHAGDDVTLTKLLNRCLLGEIRPSGIGEWSVADGVQKLMAMC